MSKRARATHDDIRRIIARLCPRRPQRDRRRLRRRPDPWRQRLSDRPIPARRRQLPHRRIWRLDREPAALHDARCSRPSAARSAWTASASASRPTSSRRASRIRDPIALFTALAARLEELGVPWIELREAAPADFGRRHPDGAGQPGDARRSIPARSCSTATMTGQAPARGWRKVWPTAISFGRPFIANPDLVHRLAIGAPLSAATSALSTQAARRLRRLSAARRGEGRLGRRISREARTAPARPARRRRPCRLARGRRGRSPAPHSRRSGCRCRWRSRRASASISAAGAFLGDDLEMIGFAADHDAERDEGAEAAALGGERDRAGQLERAGDGDGLMLVAGRLDRRCARRRAACR